MTTRVLDRSEWPRLEGTELGTVWHILPDDAQVLVVEDDHGQIVGCWSTYRREHVEGVWVAEEHRGRGVVFRHLLREMRQLVHDKGHDVVWTGALATPDGEVVAEMLKKLGAFELPGRHFAWRI